MLTSFAAIPCVKCISRDFAALTISLRHRPCSSSIACGSGNCPGKEKFVLKPHSSRIARPGSTLNRQVLDRCGSACSPGRKPTLVEFDPVSQRRRAILPGHVNLTLPVNSSCIMPCLSRRVLASLASSAPISASMSDKMAAMAVCSATVGGKSIGSNLTNFAV